MSVTCKKRLSIRRYGGSVDGASVPLTVRTAELTVRAVDAAGTGIAFTARLETGPEFHFDAGEAWTIDRLVLDAPLTLVIASAAGSTVEAIVWEG